MTSLKSLLLTLCIIYISASASPVARRDEPPRIEDTLAVAKSPFEPVTSAFSSPDARNEAPSTIAEVADDKVAGEHLQSTRSTQVSEQEKDSTSVSAMNDSSIVETSAATQPISETTEPVATTSPTEPESPTPGDLESPTTTVSPVESERLPETTPVAQTSTTTTPPVITTTTTTTTTAPTSTTENLEKSATSEPLTTTTAEAPRESTTLTSTEPSAEDETETATTLSPTKPESTTSTTALAREQITTTSTTLAPTTTSTATPESTPESVTTTSTTTTQAPATSTETLTTLEPERSTTSSTTPPPESEDKKDQGKKVEGDNENKNAACNHLPTYQADEVQKVFREETTYKNGTIKGKFTYINFDQRYRLVHYTRLPYGPVKIDLVEELGRPEQAGNQSSPPVSNDAFNSVLQLRNFLPNSLFDFPFSRPQPNISKPVREEDDGRSNMYFYSTENISTPNLLTPSVPVSLPTGQHRLSQPSIPTNDITTPNYYDNTSVQQQADVAPSVRSKQSNTKTPPGINEFSPIFATPNQHQFQYAISSPTNYPSAEANRQQVLLYNYLSQAQAQYQYSPLPLYSFQQPSYYYARALAPQPLNLSGNKLKQDQSESETISFAHQQTHQPHSHEHYVAPFMFNQPPSTSSNDQNESSRLKLKVKTSKALSNPEPYTKSAQLRSSQASLNSPSQVHRQHRHRSGKQNQDLRSNVNNSPVVYHVLRSPAGRVYSLPQYQGYAMTYDHEE